MFNFKTAISLRVKWTRPETYTHPPIFFRCCLIFFSNTLICRKAMYYRSYNFKFFKFRFGAKMLAKAGSILNY